MVKKKNQIQNSLFLFLVLSLCSMLLFSGSVTAIEFRDSNDIVNIDLNDSSGNLNLARGNLTVGQTGFFGWLGSLANRITTLFVQDINVNGTLRLSNATAGYGGFRYNDGSSKLQYSNDNGTTWDNVGSGGNYTGSGGSFYGGLRWDTTPNCQWSGTTSTGGIANYSADTECDDEARTAYGLTTSNTAAGNSEGQLPQIKFNSMPSGYYRIVATGMFAASASGEYHCAWRFATDGGLTTQFSGVTNQNEFVPNIEGMLYVPSDLGATTIQVQFSAGWTTSACEIDVNDDTVDANQDFEIDVYYFPSFGTAKNDTVFSDLDGDTRINVDGNGNDSDDISFFTNGTQRAIITSDGNVGIGTTNLNAQLSLTEDIEIQSFTPSNTTNKIYGQNGTLYYDGEQVGTGGSYNKPEMITAYFDMRDDPTTSGSGIGGTATLTGSAVYNSTNEWVRLTENATSQNGNIYWRVSPGESLKASFDFWIQSATGADAVWFFLNGNKTPGTETQNIGSGGYIFAFDENDNNFQLNRNGSTLATASGDWWADGEWHRAVITKEGPKFHISVDGQHLLTYQDNNSIEASGTFIGFGARTGGTTNQHLVRRLEIISPVTPWESNYDISENYGIGTGYNVGIGTTSPGQKLTVVGDANITGNLDIDSNTFFVNASADSVGVGTSTPRGIFDVRTGAGENVYLTENTTVGTTATVFIPGHVYYIPYGGGDVVYLQARREDNSGTAEIQFRTFNSSSMIEAMRIQGDGDVGIGTGSPLNKLTVANNNVNGVGLELRSDDTTLNSVDYSAARLFANFSSTNYADSRLFLQTATNENTWKTGLVIKNGNVGIGTDSPSAPLHIFGGGTGSGLLINGTNGQLQFNDGSIIQTTRDTLYLQWAGGNINFDNGGMYFNGSSHRLGIGTTSPNAALTVQDSGATQNPFAKAGGFYWDTLENTEAILGLSTDDAGVTGEYFIRARTEEDSGGDDEFLFRTNGNANADGSFTGGGADYAEWFIAEETIAESSLVGLNLRTGKVRVWREGDPLVGVQSVNPGFVGNNLEAENSEEDMLANGYALVGLVGQLDISSPVLEKDGMVYTPDGRQFIGYRLSDGKFFLNRDGGAIQELKTENDVLKLENEAIKQTLCEMGREEWC